MGEVKNIIESSTEQFNDGYTNSEIGKTLGTITSTASDLYDAASQGVILTLSKAWIGIGLARPATTERKVLPEKQHNNVQGSSGATLDRFNYKKLYSLQIGDYFMPLSQTFTLRAKKRLNISALVDGVDIIQQTRKEAKTIDCTLRISLRDNQPNLHIVRQNKVTPSLPFADVVNRTELAAPKVATLAKFLQDFYEKDAIFAIQNETINDTFGVQHVFISEYRFTPRAGMGTFTFEFSLTEVKYAENAITFNLRGISADTKA